MAFTFPFLKSAFTSLAGANVDVGVLRAAIVNGGIILQDLLDQPEGIRWIDEAADPTIQFSFVTDLPGPEETELNSIVAAHTGPFAVSDAVRVFLKTGKPTVTDDSNSGFKEGDEWRDSVTDHVYVAGDVTPGSAKWHWQSGWGQSRPDEVVKLGISLQTDDEASPDANQFIVTDGSGDWDLKDFGASRDRGYFEDFGAVTSTSSATPVTRMSENPTLLVGRYAIGWTSEMGGTATGTEPLGRFSFDGGLIDEYIADGTNKFNGRIERVVTAGAKAFLLEVAKNSGGGSAEMGKSTMWYRWISLT